MPVTVKRDSQALGRTGRSRAGPAGPLDHLVKGERGKKFEQFGLEIGDSCTSQCHRRLVHKPVSMQSNGNPIVDPHGQALVGPPAAGSGPAQGSIEDPHGAPESSPAGGPAAVEREA